MTRRHLIKSLVAAPFVEASPEKFESSLIFDEFFKSKASYGIVFYKYKFGGAIPREDFQKFSSLDELTNLESDVYFEEFVKPVFYVYNN